MLDRATRQERALVVALVASLLLWNLPLGGIVLYPFKLLATWLHEMSHGMVMLATGAGFSHLEIFRDTSGIAYAERGVGGFARAAIASAGYMGAATLGGVLLVLAQSGRKARRVLMALGVALTLSLVFWVRNDFGMAAVAVGALFCLVSARLLPEGVAVFVVNFIAAQACVNAVLDIRVLFRPQLVINGQVVGKSDANNMASATFGNHWLWAGVWLAWSFACAYTALRIIYLRRRSAGAATSPGEVVTPAAGGALVEATQAVALPPATGGARLSE